MTYTYFWPPESEPPDYEPENYDRGLGVDRDPSWRTRGLPDRPSVWPAGIYWDEKSSLPFHLQWIKRFYPWIQITGLEPEGF